MKKKNKTILYVAILAIAVVVALSFNVSKKYFSGFTQIPYSTDIVNCLDSGKMLDTCTNDENLDNYVIQNLKEANDYCIDFHGIGKKALSCLDDLVIKYQVYNGLSYETIFSTCVHNNGSKKSCLSDENLHPEIRKTADKIYKTCASINPTKISQLYCFENELGEKDTEIMTKLPHGAIYINYDKYLELNALETFSIPSKIEYLKFYSEEFDSGPDPCIPGELSENNSKYCIEDATWIECNSSEENEINNEHICKDGQWLTCGTGAMVVPDGAAICDEESSEWMHCSSDRYHQIVKYDSLPGQAYICTNAKADWQKCDANDPNTNGKTYDGYICENGEWLTCGNGATILLDGATICEEDSGEWLDCDPNNYNNIITFNLLPSESYMCTAEGGTKWQKCDANDLTTEGKVYDGYVCQNGGWITCGTGAISIEDGATICDENTNTWIDCDVPTYGNMVTYDSLPGVKYLCPTVGANWQKCDINDPSTNEKVYSDWVCQNGDWLTCGNGAISIGEGETICNEDTREWLDCGPQTFNNILTFNLFPDLSYICTDLGGTNWQECDGNDISTEGKISDGYVCNNGEWVTCGTGATILTEGAAICSEDTGEWLDCGPDTYNNIITFDLFPNLSYICTAASGVNWQDCDANNLNTEGQLYNGFVCSNGDWTKCNSNIEGTALFFNALPGQQFICSDDEWISCDSNILTGVTNVLDENYICEETSGTWITCNEENEGTEWASPSGIKYMCQRGLWSEIGA
ncbi:hypothetical protein ACFL21_00775 [Patescibacteria group bacterium]